jgi:hypothetical protein
MLSSFPMSAIPGDLESARLPKAVPVVSALKTMARAVGERSKVGLPGAPPQHEVDVEGDADAEEQRQRDDVCEIERQADGDAGRQREQSGEQ